MDYSKYFSTKQTSQSEAIPGTNQVENNAGGYDWVIDKWQRLERFLILGSENGTYYVSEMELTKDNAQSVLECIKEDGKRVVDVIVDISDSGRAPKNDPALFALAMCASLGNDVTRKYAFSVLSKVARIGTHLFHFVQYCKAFRGWGRGMREGIASWYNDKPIDKLQYQILKYRQRDGWSHRDLLRLSHVKPLDDDYNDVYKWIVDNSYKTNNILINAFINAQSGNKGLVLETIRDYHLTREMVPTSLLNDVDIWRTLLKNMPLMAMIRNLGKMTDVGLLIPFSDEVNTVCEKLNADYIKKSRVHPLSILTALRIYEQGQGMKGSLEWNPVTQIVDALDNAFYLAFQNVEPINKRIMLALDVSGSMTWGTIAGSPITPREGTAAMALITAKTETQYMFTVFADQFIRLNISPRQRLDDVIKEISGLSFGRTDCAVPMIYALKKKINIDTFIIYTDNETWAGTIHPAQALNEYRRKINPKAKLVVVGMTSTGFSIADPNDGGMMDVVGFDTATPNVISDFARR